MKISPQQIFRYIIHDQAVPGVLEPFAVSGPNPLFGHDFGNVIL
jgi:hypothetical protein